MRTGEGYEVVEVGDRDRGKEEGLVIAYGLDV